MDSIEFKAQQLKTSLQSLYTAGGLEQGYKWLLDVGNAIIKQWGQMPSIIGIPTGMITDLGAQFWNLAHIVTTVFKFIKAHAISETRITNALIQAEQSISVESELTREQQLTNSLKNQFKERQLSYIEAQEAMRRANQNRVNSELTTETRRSANGGLKGFAARVGEGNTKTLSHISMASSIGSLALGGIGTYFKNQDNTTSRRTGGIIGAASTTLSGISMGAMFGPVYRGAATGSSAVPDLRREQPGAGHPEFHAGRRQYDSEHGAVPAEPGRGQGAAGVSAGDGQALQGGP